MEKLHVGDNFIENEVKTSFWDFKGKFDFVDKWFLMETPYPVLLIISAYLLFVLKLGPEYMKNRRRFEMKNVLLVYNAFQVCVSALMVYWCIEFTKRKGIIQRTCLTDTYESKYELATMIHYYFFCKLTELLDTVLFVLRKKQNQVTFLHVYHHTMMAMNGWVFLKYEPAYWMLFLGLMNCFVHVVMYAYYGLSAYPSLRKYLWWKKYITSLQLLQFGLLIIQMTITLCVTECKPTKWTILYVYINTMLFIYMFSKFYIKSYTKKDDKKMINGVNNENSNNNVTHKTEMKRKNASAEKNGVRSSKLNIQGNGTNFTEDKRK